MYHEKSKSFSTFSYRYFIYSGNTVKLLSARPCGNPRKIKAISHHLFPLRDEVPGTHKAAEKFRNKLYNGTQCILLPWKLCSLHVKNKNPLMHFKLVIALHMLYQSIFSIPCMLCIATPIELATKLRIWDTHTTELEIKEAGIWTQCLLQNPCSFYYAMLFCGY